MFIEHVLGGIFEFVLGGGGGGWRCLVSMSWGGIFEFVLGGGGGGV